jgi:hypothetical protein
MSDSGYVPETFFVDSILGVDDITSVTDNGDAPNMIIKSRYPVYSQESYPELHRLTSNDELSNLKNQTPANHLLQKFTYDDANLVEGRYSIIRSIDIIYGSNLDVINMGGYKQSTVIPLSFSATELIEGSTKLNQKSRIKYITKEVGKFAKNDYHTDEDSVILDYTGSLLDVDSIRLGDYIRSIDFVDFNDNHAANLTTFGWDSTLQQSNDTLTQMSSSLNTIVSSSVDTIYVRITLEDGKTWADAPSCTYYIQESGSLNTRFEKVNKMYVGDRLITTNADTNELTTLEIVSLEMEHAQKTIYSLDFEPSDLFLVDIGDGVYSVMHNSCWCPWTYCGYYCHQAYCPTCDFGVK